MTVERTFNSPHSVTFVLTNGNVGVCDRTAWLLWRLLGSHGCPDCVLDLCVFALFFSVHLTLFCISVELCSQTLGLHS